MKRLMAGLLAMIALGPSAWSFCGFYVAQEPGNLFNKSSKVVLARDGDHTVLTMASDYRGEPSEFGLVVPVPVVIQKGMVNVTEQALVDKLDQYTVPRLAQYYDTDPCSLYGSNILTKQFLQRIPAGRTYQSAVQTVRVEASFDVEEYDITVIAGDTGKDVAQWLIKHGYHLPEGSVPVLESYVKQGMHFFLAKIDLDAQEKSGSRWPRPLQLRYDSPKFMLPVRLGTVNADGAQDLIVLALTKGGRVETTNYRTSRMPTGEILPEAVAEEGRFNKIYEAIFDAQVARDQMSNVYLEYAWPLSQQCDPCSGEISPQGLVALGASWTNDYHSGFDAGFVTRLHVRYDAAHFPEDLVFQETADRQPWQVRFVAHRSVTPARCEEAGPYLASVAERERNALETLATLTGTSGSELTALLR